MAPDDAPPMVQRRGGWLAPALAALWLTGCGSLSQPGFLPGDGAPAHPIDVSAIPDAVPRVEPHSAYGNPPEYEVDGRVYTVLKDSRGYVERGIASWYGTKFHEQRTSSGEDYDMYAMTAAHKTLPLPTYVQVTDLDNGAQVIVKVNDRGPFLHDRLIDLSYAAAAKLGMLTTGTAPVEVRAIDPVRYAERRRKGRETGTAGPRQYAMYVQVGAFADRSNAERMRRRVQHIAAGGVHITPAQIEDQTVYRVRIGPLHGVDDADDLVSTLSQHGITTADVVVD